MNLESPVAVGTRLSDTAICLHGIDNSCIQPIPSAALDQENPPRDYLLVSRPVSALSVAPIDALHELAIVPVSAGAVASAKAVPAELGKAVEKVPRAPREFETEVVVKMKIKEEIQLEREVKQAKQNLARERKENARKQQDLMRKKQAEEEALAKEAAVQGKNAASWTKNSEITRRYGNYFAEKWPRKLPAMHCD
jgi:hypothetical protein